MEDIGTGPCEQRDQTDPTGRVDRTGDWLTADRPVRAMAAGQRKTAQKVDGLRQDSGVPDSVKSLETRQTLCGGTFSRNQRSRWLSSMAASGSLSSDDDRGDSSPNILFTAALSGRLTLTSQSLRCDVAHSIDISAFHGPETRC